MRILLAGAAGFIGSHLAERLLRDGHEVIGVDNLVTGHERNVTPLLVHDAFQFARADVTLPLAGQLGPIGPLDWVLNLASPASPPKYLARPIETMRTNAEGTHQLLELARTRGASFLLASTSEVYGDPLVHPQDEGYWGNVRPHGPRSVYDEAKRYAEAMTFAYHRTFGVDTRTIRIFNTYGPRMDPWDGRVVTTFVREALAGEPLTVYGSGEQTRSFQYVDDLVEGVVRYLGVRDTGPVNLGNPDEFTMLELAALVLELTGSDSGIVYEPLPEDDPRQRRPDITLARRLLGWEPAIPLQTGLARTIDAMRAEIPAPAVSPR